MINDKVVNFSFSDDFSVNFPEWLFNWTSTLPNDIKKLLILTPTRRSAKNISRIIKESPLFKPHWEINVACVFNLKNTNAPSDEIESSNIKIFTSNLVKKYFKNIGIEKSLNHCFDLAQTTNLLLEQLFADEIGVDAFLNLNKRTDLAEKTEKNIHFLEYLYKNLLDNDNNFNYSSNKNIIKDINELCNNWKNSPPNHPIVAVGLNGSPPAIDRLVKVIYNLPFSKIVLYGMQTHDGNVSCNFGQKSFQRFLSSLGVNFTDVHHISKKNKESFDYEAFLNEALSGNNPLKTLVPDLPNLSIIECDTPQEEAFITAFLARKINSPLFISNNASLMMRINAILKSHEKKLAFSQLDPLTKGQDFTWLKQSGDVISSGFLIYETLEFLKRLFQHNTMIYKELLTFEIFARSTPVSDKKFIKIIEKHDDFIKSNMPESLNVFFEFKAFILNHQNTLKNKTVIYEWFVLHNDFIDFLDKISADYLKNNIFHKESAFRRIWQNLNTIITPIKHEKVYFHEYIDICSKIFWSYEKNTEKTENLPIPAIGVLESRLLTLQKNSVILTDANDDAWPPANLTQCVLSPNILKKLGCFGEERKNELIFLEFIKCLCCQKVIITRSKTIGGSPTEPCRWLVQLTSSLEQDGHLARKRGEAIKKEAFSDGYKTNNKLSRQIRPEVQLPIGETINELSLNDFCKIYSNSYELWAKHSLKLTSLYELYGEANINRLYNLKAKNISSENSLWSFREKRILNEINKKTHSNQNIALKQIKTNIILDLGCNKQLKINTTIDELNILKHSENLEIKQYSLKPITKINNIKLGYDLKTNLKVIMTLNKITPDYQLNKINFQFLNFNGGFENIQTVNVPLSFILQKKNEIILNIKHALHEITNTPLSAGTCVTPEYKHLSREKEWTTKKNSK